MSVETTPRTRAAVSCKHFGQCGGCDLLDLPYGKEIGEKASFVDELFAPVMGGRSAVFHAAKQPLFYRSKLKVAFANTADTLIGGFYRRGTHKVQNVRQCRIQEPELLKVLETVRRHARLLNLRGYSEGTGRGILRHLVARRALSGQILAGVVVRRSGEKKVRQLAEAVFSALQPEGLVGVIENHNPKEGNRILGRQERTLEGVDRLQETWRGLEIETGLASFFQAHRTQADLMYDLVLEELGELEGQHIADVYAGWGPMSLLLAKAGARVSAVENERRAVADGRANAERNGLADRRQFLESDAAAGIGALTESSPPDAVILDPPRAGLDPTMITHLTRGAVRRIVYVSCNPRALLRDVESLSIRYRLSQLQTVDLFPRTEHLELVATLDA